MVTVIPSRLETALAVQIGLAGLQQPEREVALIPKRRFRCDFVWRERRLVVEVEGGIWAKRKTRHVNPTGYERDCEKYSLLALLGYRVLRVTQRHIESGQALTWIEQALAGEGMR